MYRLCTQAVRTGESVWPDNLQHDSPEPAMLFDSAVLYSRLAFRHTVLEVSLHGLRQLLKIAIAESALLFARVVCCPNDLLNFLSYGPTKLICC